MTSSESEMKNPKVLTARGYPVLRSPRWRFRRPHHLQDRIRLELDVPASMIPWLEAFEDWTIGGIEGAAVYLLATAVMNEQKLMSEGRSVHGGRGTIEAIRRKVEAFLAEPVNCGPGFADARAFAGAIAEIHGESNA